MLSCRELWQAAPQLTQHAAASAPASPASSSIAVTWATTLGRRLGLLSAAADEEQESEQDGTAWEEGACVFCNASPPHTVQVAPCGHSCCYFCIASARMASSRARCPHCSERLGEG